MRHEGLFLSILYLLCYLKFFFFFLTMSLFIFYLKDRKWRRDKRTCYWIFWHQPFKPSWHILDFSFEVDSTVRSDLLGRWPVRHYLWTLWPRLLESCSLYLGLNKCSSIPSHWYLGPELANLPYCFYDPSFFSFHEDSGIICHGSTGPGSLKLSE